MTFTIPLDFYTITTLAIGVAVGFALARRDMVADAVRYTVLGVAGAVGVFAYVCVRTTTPPLVLLGDLLTAARSHGQTCPAVDKPALGKPAPKLERAGVKS